MKRILVVDDDPSLPILIQACLEKDGYEVDSASDGSEALTRAKMKIPDLIISDVNMGGFDGYEMLNGLKKDPVLRTIPCIFMTGGSDFDGMRKAMNEGADDYLIKPFKLESLRAAVQARFDKQAALTEKSEKKLTELRNNISLMLPHELNTPLVGVIGYGELISTCPETLSTDELRDMGKAILQSGHRLQRLIQNFLLYAQIELLNSSADVQSMEQGNTADVKSLLVSLAAQVAGKHSRTADLELNLEESSVRMHGEPLSKVLDELLNNAFKFSKKGSKVNVTMSPRNGHVDIVIRDAGCGIEKQNLVNIGPYFQFNRQKNEQQGTGLGLAIAKRLVELHQGRFSIESTVGQGTTVSISLPRHP
ncbi:MAG: histidine kinase,Response regulator receiver domain proteinhistidine kinase [Verrucomicrobiales bacterium]|nr:histidine kinase,Response regulator receiver domain proteinhistidine kinase [Verrucomicrobiales bacterium]